MKIKKEYERWLANAVADTDVAAELKAMDYVEVEDAFYRDLAFGCLLYTSPDKPNGTPRKLLDVSKATNLGWTYKTELEDGIRCV